MTTQQNQYDQPERGGLPSTSTQNALLFWTIISVGLTFLILAVTIASLFWTMLH